MESTINSEIEHTHQYAPPCHSLEGGNPELSSLFPDSASPLLHVRNDVFSCRLLRPTYCLNSFLDFCERSLIEMVQTDCFFRDVNKKMSSVIIAFLTLFFVFVAVTAWAASTRDMQEDIRREWAQVEKLSSQYTALKNSNRKKISQIQTEIEELKTRIAMVPPESSAGYGYRTQLTELLTQKHKQEYEKYTRSIKLISKTITHIIQVEENLEMYQKAHGAEENTKHQQYNQRVLATINQELNALQKEQSQLQRKMAAVNNNGEHLRWVEGSIKDCKELNLIVQAMLRTQSARNPNVKEQRFQAFNYRRAFEKLQARLHYDKAHHKSALLGIKTNAEFMALNIMTALMNQQDSELGKILTGESIIDKESLDRQEDWDEINLIGGI